MRYNDWDNFQRKYMANIIEIPYLDRKISLDQLNGLDTTDLLIKCSPSKEIIEETPLLERLVEKPLTLRNYLNLPHFLALKTETIQKIFTCCEINLEAEYKALDTLKKQMNAARFPTKTVNQCFEKEYGGIPKDPNAPIEQVIAILKLHQEPPTDLVKTESLINLIDLQFIFQRLNPKKESLAISKTTINAIPTNITNLSYLTTLKITDNKDLKTLPLELFLLKKLTFLCICANQIVDIHPDIRQLQQLRDLRLNNNQIKTLPDTFSELPNLIHFMARGNQISKLPSNFGKLKLQTLSLSQNKFKTFPPEILNMTSLTSLSFHGNQIKEIPDAISRLRNLKVLKLSDNQLTTLPDSILKLKKIEKIYLSNNLFTNESAYKIISDMISAFPKLAVITIDGNDIDPAIRYMIPKGCTILYSSDLQKVITYQKEV